MLLIPFSHRIEHALTPASINYYELIAPANGFVTIDMIHCAGQLNIGVSQDYESFLEREYRTEIKSTPGTSHTNIFKVKAGQVFVAIASEIEESFYKLRPDFFKTVKAIPHSKILAGNMGIVNHERTIGGKTIVKFSPIICEQCSKEILS